MRIKVFKAADLKEAMAMVKDELGRDAVILHTKRYKQGGFLGYKTKEVVEVTAAVDDVPRRPRVKLPVMPRTSVPATPAAAQPQSQTAARPLNVLSQYKTAGTEAGVSMARAQGMDGIQPLADFTPMPEPLLKPSSKAQSSRKTTKLRTGQKTAPVHMPPDAESEPVRPNIEELQTALAEPILSGLEPEMEEPLRQPEPPAPKKKKSHVIKAETLARKKTAKEEPEPPGLVDRPAAPPVVGEDPLGEEILPAEESARQEKINELEEELAQMRQMLRQVMNQSPNGEEGATLRDALSVQELRDDVMQDIIRKVPPATMMLDKDSPEAVKALGEYLHGVLKTGTGIGLKAGRPKIVALIGTTGVGKTTTIAKIAAKFVLEKGVREIALIAADNYRIAAVEQLKTYSDILGLPLEVVFTTADLKTKLRQHRDKKLILIDTAGRSQNNEEQMGELKAFLATEPSIEKHLVLSATTKERDAEVIFERFSACRPDRILLTKTDETKSLGFLVNLLYDRRLALSYLTTGQTVPDDIEPALPEALARLMLR
ncbi:MAG: flagellar biosynthesis protein FlhF [Schwartzia sp.]|nr:flagellar biosynthesis protein FlhF [Schwartzia sp. (in: firmicutes)]